MKPTILLFFCLCFTVLLQAQVSKTINLSIPGGLTNSLTSEEKITVTNLTITGTIDARDFKTMRDEMPVLEVLDLTSVQIRSYYGTLGTSSTVGYTSYPQSTIPQNAFMNNMSLKTVCLPYQATSIGESAFMFCNGLTNITIPTKYQIQSGSATIGSSAFMGCPNLASVTLPSNIISIGQLAFNMCVMLKTMNIPSSVVYIHDNAFSFCNGLTSVTIPSSVLSIGMEAFSNCSSLTSIVIPTSITAINDNTFMGDSSLVSVTIPSSVTSIGMGAFFGCRKLGGTLTIPSSVTTIGGIAFAECHSLSSLIIPSSVITIESQAFNNCNSLASISVSWGTPLNISESINVFYNVDKANCKLIVPFGKSGLYSAANQWGEFLNIAEKPAFSLTQTAISIPVSQGSKASVSITASATWTASSNQSWLSVSPITGTTNAELLLTADANSTGNTRSATVTISSTGAVSQTITVTQGVQQTEKTVYATAGGLSSALNSTEKSTISKLTVTGTIDARDFKTMRDELPILSEVDLSNVTIVAYTGTGGTYNTSTISYAANTIPSSAFSQKTSLSKIEFPRSINEIGQNAFSGCTQLISISIPEGVATIIYGAFQGCSGSTSISIPQSTIKIEESSFYRCSGSISVDNSNPRYSAQEGVLFNKDKTVLIQCPTSKTGSYIIPSSVDTIYSAFVSCTNLASVTIPSTVKGIYYSAFMGSSCQIDVNTTNPNYSSNNGCLFNKDQSAFLFCPITKTGEYVIPSTVKGIEQWSFYNCSALTSIIIPSSVTYVGYYSFCNCMGLISVTIPSSVTSIGSSSFNGCKSLTSIAIPSSVKSIGYSAFYGCSGLTSLTVDWITPLDLSQVTNVFSNVNKNSCTLHVPYGTAGRYSVFSQWKDFTSIVESTQGFLVGTTNETIVAGGGKDTIKVTSTIPWTATLDQSWLAISPSTGTGNKDIVLTTEPNPSCYSRTATITFSATGFPTQTVSVKQEALPKVVDLTAGNLSTTLTVEELSGISKLVITGTIDARDFKTIRDQIPQLEFLDLSGATIVGYKGTGGTVSTNSITYPVNTIPDYAFLNNSTWNGKNSLTTVTLPTTITAIGNYAFSRCTGLTSIVIPPSVLTIGSSAFETCSSLTSITIPSSVTTIKSYAFSNCTKLNTITIPSSISSIESYAFNNCSGLLSIYADPIFPVDLASSSSVFGSVNKTTCKLYVTYQTAARYVAANQWKDFTTIVEGTSGFLLGSTKENFISSGGKDTVSITSNVTWMASSNQTWLSISPLTKTGNGNIDLTVEANPTYFVRTAKVTVSATGCTSQTLLVTQEALPKLIDVTPGNLSSILTFEELNGLTKLILTGSIDARDFKTMRDQMPLLSMLDLSNVSIISYTGTKGTKDTTSVTYPANTIPERAFTTSSYNLGKTSLISLTLPASVISIGNDAFRGCTGLNSLTISSSVATIGNNAFSYCTGLTSIILPSSVTTIGSSAFSNCSKLTSFTIPSSVNSISYYAFENCRSLRSIYANPIYPVDLTNSSGVFNNVDKTACILYVTYQTASRYASAVQWKDFTTIVDETSGFLMESSTATIAANEGSIANVGITANVPWTATTDQSWLTASPLTGNVNTSIVLTAKANTSPIARVANLTVSANGKSSQKVKVTQNGTNKIIEIMAGGLLSALTLEELNGITNLTLKGTMDARDFKTMRDNMPLLSVLDLSGVSIAAYIGTGGTCPDYWGSMEYPANEIAQYAFYVPNSNKKTTKLTSFIFPATATSIGSSAFYYCGGLKTILIPSTITSINYQSFGRFSGSITVDANNPNYSSIDGVLFNKTQTQLVQCPISKTGDYNIPSQVTEIGRGAFDGCTGLIFISMPTTVTAIQDRSFYGCTGLTSLIIPTSVINISSQVFSGCTGLKSMVIPPSVISMGYGTFEGCMGLTSVTLPSGLMSIGSSTFSNCTGLTTISIPSSVTSIQNRAFSNCTGLTSIYAYPFAPVNLSSEQDVFQNVNKTTCTLYVPQGTKPIYQSSAQWQDFITIKELPYLTIFPNKVNLLSVEGSKGSVTVNSNTTWNVSSNQDWLSVDPATGNGNDTITFIATENLNKEMRTATVTISGNGLESKTITIEQDMPGMRTINMGAGNLSSILTSDEKNTVTGVRIFGTMDARDFKTIRDECPLLSVIDLSGVSVIAYTGTLGTAGTYSYTYNANTIPQYAFYNSTTDKGKESLTKVTIPSTVTAIGDYAYKKITGIDSITISSSVNTISQFAFEGSTGMFKVDANNFYFSSADGVLFNKAKTTLIKCPISKVGFYSIPTTVVTIGNSAFVNCRSLTSILIPSSVTSIGISSFSNCGLNKVTIPSSVTSIGINAFYYCSNLTSVFIPSSVTSIGSGAFTQTSGLFTVDPNNSYFSNDDRGVLFNKAKTTLIQCPTSLSGNYPIPSSVTSIGASAFYWCNRLKMVVIPSSVTSIGSNAFNSCYGLTSIYAYSTSPVSLASSSGAFQNVSTSNCILYVPSGSLSAYQAAVQWKDFTKIVEGGFWLSTNTALLSNSANSTASVTITSGVVWSASSDKTWLSVSPGTGSRNDVLVLTAEANPSYMNRTATVTISATGLASQTITVSQVAKEVNVTAGNLSNILSDDELAGATNLKITGTLDARDFVTMRDSMPNLAEIDLSEVNILAYSGTKGTAGSEYTEYPENEIPQYTFNKSYPGNNTDNGSANLTLRSIVFPESITSIGKHSFWCCYELNSSIIIPEFVTRIGNNAFTACNEMISVTIPASVTTIEDCAFLHSSGFMIVNPANQNYSSLDGVLFDKNQTRLIHCSTSLTGNYTIPSSVDSIGAYAFASSNLTSVYIPVTVSKIKEYAFWSSNIKEINIPTSISIIEKYTFRGCRYLNSISIPSTVTTIEWGSFSDCSAFITVNTNNPNYSSSDGLLYNKTKTDLIQCPISKTGSYTIPSSVVSIGSEAFFVCRNLTSIIIPSSVLSFGQEAFRECDGLTTIKIPESVNSIGYVAFAGCDNLNSINIPSSVKSIQQEAFWDCISLDSIYAYPATPIDLSNSYEVFNNVNKTTCTLIVPFGSSNLYANANQWKAFTNIQEMPGFTLSSSTATIAAIEGSTNSITVSSNTSWSISSNQSWLKVTPTSGTNNGTLVLTATVNTISNERTAIVTVSATGFPSQTITVTQAAGEAGVPVNTTVSSITLASGKVDCFNATDTISVAGNGTTVVFESSSSATLIAGNSIRFLPGFHAQSGSWMDAHITTTNSFCIAANESMLAAQVEEKSIAVAETEAAVFIPVEKSIKVYPNPNNGQFFLEVSNFENRVTVSIYNMLGSKVYESEMTNGADHKINLLGIKKGIYFVKVTDRKEQFTKKIIVR